jgi:hypothetical protein
MKYVSVDAFGMAGHSRHLPCAAFQKPCPAGWCTAQETCWQLRISYVLLTSPKLHLRAGLLYCMDYLHKNLDWLHERVQPLLAGVPQPLAAQRKRYSGHRLGLTPPHCPPHRKQSTCHGRPGLFCHPRTKSSHHCRVPLAYLVLQLAAQWCVTQTAILQHSHNCVPLPHCCPSQRTSQASTRC